MSRGLSRDSCTQPLTKMGGPDVNLLVWFWFDSGEPRPTRVWQQPLVDNLDFFIIIIIIVAIVYLLFILEAIVVLCCC